MRNTGADERAETDAKRHSPKKVGKGVGIYVGESRAGSDAALVFPYDVFIAR